MKHKLKRMKNFLYPLELNADFWKSYVPFVFSLPYFKLGRRKYITLSVDAATPKDDFWILAASIDFCGRAVPVHVKSWTRVNKPIIFGTASSGF